MTGDDTLIADVTYLTLTDEEAVRVIMKLAKEVYSKRQDSPCTAQEAEWERGGGPTS